jgi:hypothetical protein
MSKTNQALPAKMRVDAGRQSLEDMLRTLHPFMPNPDARSPQSESHWRLPEERATEKAKSSSLAASIY